MAKVRRVIRKVARAKVPGFDDQLWPINLALLVLAGFVAGVIIATCRFDDPRILRNGWFWMSTLALTVGGLFYAALRLNRTIARRMQLAVVISLIFHVILAIWLKDRYLEMIARQEEEALEDIEQRELPTLPEYVLQPPDQPQQQEFERPLDTPKPESQPVEQPQKKETPNEIEPPKQPVDTPEPEKKQEPTRPSPIKLQREEFSAPRRADSKSKLSKQTEMAQASPQAPVAAPQSAEPRPTESSPKLAANNAQVRRQQDQATAPKQPPVEAPSTLIQKQTVEVASRAENPTDAPQASSTPTLKREIAKATQVPRADMPREVPSKPAQSTEAQQLAAAAQSLRRAEATLPAPTQPTTEPSPTTPSTVADAQAARQQPSEPRPTLAQTAKPAPSRRPVETSIAATAETATPAAAAQPSTSKTAPTPQQIVVGRTATSAETPAKTAPTMEQAQPREVARLAPSRAQAAETPTIRPTDAPSQQPRRAESNAPAVAAAAAQVDAASPNANASGAEGPPSQLAPGASALAKQETGSPHVNSRSFEPTPNRPTEVAQAAAATRQQTNNTQPTLARADKPAPSTSRAPAEAAAAVEAMTLPGSSRVAANANPQSTPGPQSTDVARQSATVPGSASSQGVAADVPQSTSGSLTRSTAARAQAAESPSLLPNSRPTDQPRRAADAGIAATSPQSIESPALAQSSSQDIPTARPSNASLSKADTGMVGRGQSDNADVALKASPRNSAPTASVAARRKTATTEATGPQLSPSAPARVAKAEAGADAPSATALAENVDAPEMAGSARPSELAAAASAATQRSNAAAPVGNVSAAVGELEVDTGPTQIVPNTGTGRAAGGGQPEIALNSQSNEVARARSGGATLAAIEAAEVAPTPAAAAADGGGSPSQARLAAAKSAAGKTGSGDPLPTLGQAGAATPSPQAGAAGGQVQAKKIARAEMTSGGAAGGGNPTRAPTVQGPPARSAAGGAPLAAMATDVNVDTPAAPAGDGGGAPTAPAASAVASAPGRQASEAALPATAQLPTNPGAGSATGQVAANAVARAAPAETIPGTAVGGGTAQPAKSKLGEVAMVNPAAMASLAEIPSEGGAPQAAPVSPQGLEAGQSASGLPAKTQTGPTGAAAGQVAVNAPAAGSPGSGAAAKQAARTGDAAPNVAAGAVAAAPLRQGTAANLPSGMVAEVARPELAMAAPSTDVGEPQAQGPAAGADAPARVAGSLPVRTDATVGPGGLGLQFTAEVGLPSRRAQAESEIVHESPDRYLQKKVGGIALVSGQARDIAEAFDRRGRRMVEGETGGEGRPSAKTEAAIESGLDFFARHQNADGSWSLDYARGQPNWQAERVSIHSDTAATGLVLLAYLGAGYDHFDDKHQQRLANALSFLISHQKENGDLYIPQHQKSGEFAQFYSHGIATIALCEAFGMTGDPKLGEAAQKALDFIVKSQHEERGGWRYSPGYQSDISVTGWMVMALKSGQLAGLEVPEKTFDNVRKFLDKAQAPSDSTKYVYNPYAPNTARSRHGRQPSTVMTAVGQLTQLYLGQNRETPALKGGADHLLENLPRLDNPARIGTINNPMRDTYYWYYATQVMFHMKGEYWRQWNETLHPLLTNTQVTTGPYAGSWNPRTPVPDRWGPQCGRIYVTAMNILSLEVYYRHLPLYDKQLD